jgi:hypothetical protein
MDANAGGRDATLPMTGSVRRGTRAEDGRWALDGTTACAVLRHSIGEAIRLQALRLPAAGWAGDDRRSRRGWRWRDTNGNVIYHILKKERKRADRPGGALQAGAAQSNSSRCSCDTRVSAWFYWNKTDSKSSYCVTSTRRTRIPGGQFAGQISGCGAG